MPARERRTASRCLQRYLVRFEDEGEIRLAFTRDVSSDGLFLKTRFPPPPGTGLRLLIRGPQGGEHRTGSVVWARLNIAHPEHPSLGSGVGIRLHPPAPDPPPA